MNNPHSDDMITVTTKRFNEAIAKEKAKVTAFSNHLDIADPLIF